MAITTVTLNPNDSSTSNVFSNNNLTVTNTSSYAGVRATIGKSKGKWYWEVKFEVGSNSYNVFVGISNKTIPSSGGGVETNVNFRGYYGNDGNKYPENLSYGTRIAYGDVVGIALDLDSGKLGFYKNGVYVGTSHNDLSGLGEVFPHFRAGAINATRIMTYNFGGTPFVYNVPTGYLPYAWEIDKKTLVNFNNSFYSYSANSWIDVSKSPTEQDYLTYGIDDISIIPESSWSQLQGEVELCNYTDDPTKTEVSFNIETEPFTLKEEWEDKEIKIIEYTDDPNQTESTITIETEPFTLYDELGDSVDVLYYTDDPSKTSAELNITANYSPLDELEGDFDVVTWTNDEDVIAGNSDMMLTYNALPFEQLIVQPSDIALYGDVKKIIATKVVPTSAEGILKMAASFDSGLTWKTYRFNKWFEMDITNSTLFKRKGMSLDTLNAIPEKDLTGLTRIAYYFDSSMHYENAYALDEVMMVMGSPRNGVEFKDMSLQLLNTTATINVTFSGNKLKGVLEDADQGKVKYRVLLNGKLYYPEEGGFTRLMSSPFNIDIGIDERKVNFGAENTLKVEFQDYWGVIDYWETKFIGSYSGLMFMDESGDFLSDTFGGILKQLDYGVIIAGQTTLTKKVRIKNLLGYAVDNVYLEMDKKFETEGVEVQLSRQANPFLPIDYLIYGLTQPDESIDFYIRIATDIHAKPNPNGNFEMKVTADRV
ncbi:SPRY domain-containing protein [Paenibacillus sp. ov031]|uniref:SPRY domain-containing protein n=1 Tax=Paenibacillus sp. ov031 TaxID=1761879 RepID=UPI0009119415|nr:SPRY domain-containing protein [Paenibacillus sp. ov031]SHN71809.1 SPRY domain-containing protein [Paenibacillus sp. ov031]